MHRKVDKQNSSELVKVMVRLPRSIRTKIKTVAAKQEISMNRQMLDYILMGLKQEKLGDY